MQAKEHGLVPVQLQTFFISANGPVTSRTGLFTPRPPGETAPSTHSKILDFANQFFVQFRKHE